MKFYLSKPGEVYEASPFSVSVGDMHCFYTTTDSFPIVITLGNRVCFGVPGTEHQDLLDHIGETQTKAEGRFWKGKNVLTFWSEDVDITEENVKLVVDALRKRIGINPNDIHLFLDCGFDQTREKVSNLIVELTPEEYLSYNIPFGQNTKYFWDLYKKKNKLSDENEVNVASNGMSTKDIWRHYQNMDESMKNTIRLNESQLRCIVAESVRRALKEDVDDLMGMYDGEDGPTNEPDYYEDDYLEDIMVYDLIAKLGLSENKKHELLSATLYNGDDEPVGKLNDLHVKYDPRDGRNGGLVGTF